MGSDSLLMIKWVLWYAFWWSEYYILRKCVVNERTSPKEKIMNINRPAETNLCPKFNIILCIFQWKQIQTLCFVLQTGNKGRANLTFILHTTQYSFTTKTIWQNIMPPINFFSFFSHRRRKFRSMKNRFRWCWNIFICYCESS